MTQQPLQKKALSKSTPTPSSSEFLQMRPFAQTNNTVTEDEQAPPDLQAQVERASRFGHSFGKLAIQPKLTIGQSGDKYEQEADAVAAQVVQRINAPTSLSAAQGQAVQRETVEEEELQMKPLVSTIQRQEVAEEDELQMKPMVQRREAIGGGAASRDLEQSIQSAKGGGQPLDKSIRQPMEQAFGADFSGVKIHTDAQSDQLNKSIQAKAFTTGQDVFFRQGAYNPQSRGGQELLAHELTHVVQQSGATVQRSLQKNTEHHSISKAPLSSLQRFLESKKAKQEFAENRLNYVMKKLEQYEKPRFLSTKKKPQYIEDIIIQLKTQGHSDVIDDIETKRPGYLESLLGKSPYEVMGGGKPSESGKMSIDEYQTELEDYDQELVDLKEELEDITKSGVYQEYDAKKFMSLMEEKAKILQKPNSIQTFTGAKGNIAVVKDKKSIQAIVEGLAGLQEEGRWEFNFINKYGNLSAKLEQALKLGAWGNAQGSAKLTNTGIDLDAALYAALGGHLTVNGQFKLNALGQIGLNAQGRGEVFAGARIGAGANLSADIKQGFSAGFKAEAFAGLKASVEGSATLTLKNRTIFTTAASASFSVGAGGELAASVKAGIFGETEFGFNAGATLLIGGSAGATFGLNLANLGLSSKEYLFELQNLSNIRKGYSPSLTFQDNENLLRLNQLLSAVENEIKRNSSNVLSIANKPEEKRSLLYGR